MANAVRVGGNVLLLPLILRTIPPEQLGLWYLFVSLGAATALLDFGLQPTVVRAIASLWAGAPNLRANGIERPHLPARTTPNFTVLAPTIGGIRRTYGIIALISGVLMTALGWLMVFTTENTQALTATAQVAWYVFLAATTYSAYARWSPTVLGGMDGMREMARFTLWGGLVGLLAMGLALLAGGGLLSLVIGQCLQPLLTAWLSQRAIRQKTCWNKIPQGASLAVLKMLWPNMWRMGAVTVGGYLINNINTLYCSRFFGLEATASYGLSLQIVTLLQSTAVVLVATQLPRMVELRVLRRSDELRNLVAQRTVLAGIVFLGGALCAWMAGPNLLHLLHSKTQLLPLGQFAFLLGYRFLEFNHSNFAMVITTENEVPFVTAALVSGLAIAVLAYPAAIYLGLWGLMGTTALVQIAYNNWWPIRRCAQGLHTSALHLYAMGAKQLFRHQRVI